MNSETIRISVALCFLVLCGCSTFKPDKQTLNISCTPQDIRIKVNGDSYDCPAKVDVRRDSKVMIEANKQGFDSYAKQIDYHFSSAAKWDMVGTVCWFFPVFGLFSPGAWDLDQTDIAINLLPEK